MYPGLSFWKVDPVPKQSQAIEVANLKEIGHAEKVIDKLLTIPRLTKPIPTVYDVLHDNGQVKFLWTVDKGVLLYFTPNDKDNVEVIYASSYVIDKVFFRLYVQLYERFEITLLDGSFSKCFLTPMDFKTIFIKKRGKGDNNEVN